MAARETHDIGRLYFHGLRYPKWTYPEPAWDEPGDEYAPPYRERIPLRQWPLVDKGGSHEVEEPWRVGSCAVIRLPLTRLAFVVGWWDQGRSYEEMAAEEEKVALAWQQGAEAIRQYREAPWRA